MLRDDLIRDEGVKLTAYQDHLSFWTIGVGRLIDERKGGGITEDEALMLLDNDIARVKAQLDARFPWWRSLSETAQDSLCNMTFQLGIGGVSKFKNMLAALEAHNYAEARTHAGNSKWAKTDTPARAARVIAGFTTRGSVKSENSV